MAARALLLSAALVVCAAAGQTPAPDAAAQEAIVSRIRKAALEYGDRLQNFTCTQITARSTGPSATGPRWKPLETQELELNYLDHREHYKLLKVNGKTTDLQKRIKPGYMKSYNQFGSRLQNIFDPKANATFEWDHAEAGSGGGTCVFRYRVPQPTSTIVITAGPDKVQPGHHGVVWANCESGAVTHFLTETDPAEVVRKGRRVALEYRLEVRYSLATIGSLEFLLAQSAVDTALFYKTWTRTEIQFRQYRKYDASSAIRFDEEEVGPGR
jgi:hypothetical protein